MNKHPAVDLNKTYTLEELLATEPNALTNLASLFTVPPYEVYGKQGARLIREKFSACPYFKLAMNN